MRDVADNVRAQHFDLMRPIRRGAGQQARKLALLPRQMADGPVEFALVERELGRGSMALTHFFGRPQNILMACQGEQIERYLLPAVRGERMDALAMTEPDAGSDVRGMKANARRDGSDWVLNGTKHFISGAEHADFIIVFVATGEEMTSAVVKKQITTFLVDRGTPGFTIREGYKSVSHRGYKNMILEFDNCRLPDAQVLGAVGEGFKVMNEWLYATRITVATMAVGRARRVFDMMVDYAAQRKQFGQPIGTFQLMQGKIADMYTIMNACRSYVYAVARAAEVGGDLLGPGEGRIEGDGPAGGHMGEGGGASPFVDEGEEVFDLFLDAVEVGHLVEHADHAALGARAVVAGNVKDKRVVQLADLLDHELQALGLGLGGERADDPIPQVHHIDVDRLEGVHDRIEERFGKSERGAREIPGSVARYSDVLVTHEHGELGRILSVRGHKFTGPNDI